MSQVSVRQPRWLRPWVGVGLSTLVLMTWAGTAYGQTIQQVEQANQNIASFSDMLVWIGTGVFILGVVGGVVLVGMVAVRVYLRNSTTTDPLKLAMSDPWVRANLEQWQAAQANGTPSEGAAATPAEPFPAEQADVPPAPTSAPAPKD
jgi:hypothetical protein